LAESVSYKHPGSCDDSQHEQDEDEVNDRGEYYLKPAARTELSGFPKNRKMGEESQV